MQPSAAIARTDASSTNRCGSCLPRASSPTTDVRSLLERLRRCLDEIGPEFARDERRVAELSDRLQQGRFHLAVLGQFKRGKSTLLNALLGEPLLPASVVPLTAIPTFLRAGRQWQAKVAYTDGHPGEQVTGDQSHDITTFWKNTSPKRPIRAIGSGSTTSRWHRPRKSWIAASCSSTLRASARRFATTRKPP